MKSYLSGCYLFYLEIFLLIVSSQAQATTITGITAVSKYGQTFLTWNNPSPNLSNYCYAIFRKKESDGEFNSVDFASITDMSTAEGNFLFIGYTKYNSSLNQRLTECYHDCGLNTGNEYYFKIPGLAFNSIDPPYYNLTQLDAGKGLFVTTSNTNGSFYYTVLIWDGTTLDKSNLAMGIGQVLVANEAVANTLAYYQGDFIPISGYCSLISARVTNVYTQFVSNMKNTDYPTGYAEMVNKRMGYLPFNFGISHSLTDTASPHPLMIYLHAGGGSFLKNGYKALDNGIIVCMDDWLPNSDANYNSTGWFGYNEDFDVYDPPAFVPPLNGMAGSKNNLYTARRILATIDYLIAKGIYTNPSSSEAKWQVDDHRIYLSGISLGAGGSMMLAQIAPSKFAAVQLIVPKFNMDFMEDDNLNAIN